MLQLITAAPFFQQSAIVNPGAAFGATNANPFPNLPLPSQFPIYPSFPTYQGLSASGSPVFTGGNLIALNPFQRNMKTPYAEQDNFTIDRQLPANFALEVGYAGSEGVRLLDSLQENQAYLANPANPIRGVTTNSAANATARVPVVGISTTGLNEVTAAGHSSYNAFIATLSRRMDRSFLQVSYTFSKSIDNDSGSATQDLGSAGGNNLDPALQRGLSDFDRPHRLVATYQHDLPVPNQRLLKAVIGGWSVAGTTTLQSSLPIDFTCACGSNNVDGITSTIYPEALGNIQNIFVSNNWRNFTQPGTSAFAPGIVGVVPTVPAGGSLNGLNVLSAPGPNSYPVSGPAQPFGNMGRNPNLRGPFQSLWDMALVRRFKLFENAGFELRGEAFNVFNHPIFSSPNSTVGSASFGRISSTITAPRILQIAAKITF